MKIKLDENLPHGLTAALYDLGHDAQTVQQEGLAGVEDFLVWSAVKREERFLVTQDLDFSDTRMYAPGTHPGILLIRLHQPSRANLLLRVRNIFETESVDDWKGCFVVATERKIRVGKP
jgi:predicted nuclease of predicted toxin-antitoxin system